jgi:hypothetical protein
LTQEEYNAVVAVVNETLQAHANLSFLVLLLPLVLLDLLLICLLAALDPWLLLTPWEFPAGDLVVPISIEFVLFFCVFPGMRGRAPSRRIARTDVGCARRRRAAQPL